MKIPVKPHPLQWGDFVTTQSSVPVTTIAGKTLVLCLYHPTLRMGGITNFIIPGSIQTTSITESDVSEVGIGYIEFVVAEIVKAGGSREEAVAKIFGASNLNTNSAIQRSNVKFIYDYLNMEKISISAEELGQPFYREIIFIPSKGSVYARKIDNPDEIAKIQVEEEHYIQEEITRLSSETQFIQF